MRDTDAKTVLAGYVRRSGGRRRRRPIRDASPTDATWTLGGRAAHLGHLDRPRRDHRRVPGDRDGHYEPGSVRLEITGMIAEGDQVALQWTSRARTLDGNALREPVHRRVHGARREIRSVREYMDTHYAHRALAGSRRPARG